MVTVPHSHLDTQTTFDERERSLSAGTLFRLSQPALYTLLPSDCALSDVHQPLEHRIEKPMLRECKSAYQSECGDQRVHERHCVEVHW